MQTKKAVRVITLLCVLALFCQMWAVIAQAQGKAAKGLDVVFVMDFSNSMETNDPQKISGSAVTMFANKLYENCRVGAVKVTPGEVGKNDYFELTDPSTATSTLTKWYNGRFDGRGTCIPNALQKACDILKKGENQEKFIVLLTDGRNDDNGNVSKNGKAGDYDKTDNKIAEECGYKIHVVGLDGRATQENLKLDKEHLIKIASESGTEAHIVSSDKEIIKAFAEIFADYMHGKILSADVNGNKIGLSVPDGVIATSATIEIVFGKKYGKNEISFIVTDPNGKEVQPDDVLQNNSAFQLALNTPESGKWSIECKGVQEDETATVVAMATYEAVPDGAQIAANDHTVYVSGVNLTNSFGVIRNTAYCEQFNCICVIRDADGNICQSQMLGFDAASNTFSGTVEVAEDGEYTVSCVPQEKNGNYFEAFPTPEKTIRIPGTDPIPGPGSTTTTTTTGGGDNPDHRDPVNPLTIILCVVGGVAALALLAFILLKVLKPKQYLQGMLEYKVVCVDTNEFLGNNIVKLTGTKQTQADLAQLLGSDPRFATASSIILRAEGTHKKGVSKIMMSNVSDGQDCTASVGFMTLGQGEVELKRGDEMQVNVHTDKTYRITINLI